MERDERVRNLLKFEAIKAELIESSRISGDHHYYLLNPRALDQNAKIIYDERYPDE